MSVGYFIINLKNADDRWVSINRDALECGIAATRVEAIDGRAVPESEWENFDIPKWRLAHGANPRPGEYGCYMSHIKAIQAFLESDYDSAVIFEDDARIGDTLPAYVEGVHEYFGDQPIVLRLCHHRANYFRALEAPVDNRAIGHCWVGPTGSAAAYFVTRKGAQKLLKTLLPGFLPVDIMLERSWATGVPVFMVNPPLVERPKEFQSQIVDPGTRHELKFVWWKRIPAYVFRTYDFVARIFTVIITNRLPGRRS